jgi:hypothetical protein
MKFGFIAQHRGLARRHSTLEYLSPIDFEKQADVA